MRTTTDEIKEFIKDDDISELCREHGLAICGEVMRSPSGIRTYKTPQGVCVLQDELMHRQISIQPQELQYVPHILDNALHQLMGPRRKILDLVHCLLRPEQGYSLEYDPGRYCLLGEYSEPVKNLVYELSEDDDVYGSLRSTVLYRSLELHADDSWTQSAKHVMENVDCTWNQYKIRAEVSGWRVYSHEDFCLVQELFSHVKSIFNVSK